MARKVKLLSEHDVQEIVKFQEYLHDKNHLPEMEFLSKWRYYMGLTDDEYTVLTGKARQAQERKG